MSRPLSPALQKLLAEYRQALPAKLDHIMALHQAVASQTTPDLEGYHRAVHQLAGSAGSYGLPDVSTAARALDHYLREVIAGAQTWAPAEAMTLLAHLQAANRG